MKKLGMTLLVLLLIFSLAGCSGPNFSKTQAVRLPPAPQTISAPQEAAASNQLTDVDAALQSLDNALKDLDDVSDEELIIPTP